MNIKVVIVLLLVFTSAVAATALTLTGSAQLALRTCMKANVLDDLSPQPLGDPIDGGGPPHPN